MPADPPERFPSLAFAGTPAFARRILEALIDAGQPPLLVLTQPDRGAGRGRRPSPSAVKAAALAASLPVRAPANAAEIQPALAETPVDVLLVAAYGLLLPPAALAQPRLGCVNVHASLLPRWRGAAPVARALMAGDAETGISIMQMDAGLDTGPLFRRARIPIGPRATGLALENALADLGAQAVLELLPKLEGLKPCPQQGTATLAPKLKPAESIADWRQSAAELDRRIRALAQRAPLWGMLAQTRVQILAATPRDMAGAAEPGTILAAGKSEILVACGAGALSIESLKVIRGKGRTLTAADARNGFPQLFRAGVRWQ